MRTDFWGEWKMKFGKIFIYTFLALLFLSLGAKNISAQQFNTNTTYSYQAKDLKFRNIDPTDKRWNGAWQQNSDGTYSFNGNEMEKQGMDDYMATGDSSNFVAARDMKNSSGIVNFGNPEVPGMGAYSGDDVSGKKTNTSSSPASSSSSSVSQSKPESSSSSSSTTTSSSGGSGKKGALFSQLTQSGSTIFEGMKMIIYAVAGFGIVGVAIGGFFGNLNWKWLSAIIIGLLVIAMTAGILMYMTESDIKENAITIQDSLINAS